MTHLSCETTRTYSTRPGDADWSRVTERTSGVSVLSAYLHNRQGAIALISPVVEAATSILEYGEVTEYLRGRTQWQQRQMQLRELLSQITPYFLAYGMLDRYAEIRRELRPPHGPGLIGDIDTLIAATAVECGLTVVTTDGDFQRVPGLQLMLLARASLRA